MNHYKSSALERCCVENQFIPFSYYFAPYPVRNRSSSISCHKLSSGLSGVLSAHRTRSETMDLLSMCRHYFRRLCICRIRWRFLWIRLSFFLCICTLVLQNKNEGVLFISYKFVKGFSAITFMLLLISNWNVHDVCQRLLYTLIRNFSWIRQKNEKFPHRHDVTKVGDFITGYMGSIFVFRLLLDWTGLLFLVI